MICYMTTPNKLDDAIITIQDGNTKHVFPMGAIGELEINYKVNGDFKNLFIWLHTGKKIKIDVQEHAQFVLNSLSQDSVLEQEPE